MSFFEFVALVPCMPGPLPKTVQEPTSQSMDCKPGAPQDLEKSKRRSISVKWVAPFHVQAAIGQPLLPAEAGMHE